MSTDQIVHATRPVVTPVNDNAARNPRKRPFPWKRLLSIGAAGAVVGSGCAIFMVCNAPGGVVTVVVGLILLHLAITGFRKARRPGPSVADQLARMEKTLEYDKASANAYKYNRGGSIIVPEMPTLNLGAAHRGPFSNEARRAENTTSGSASGKGRSPILEALQLSNANGDTSDADSDNAFTIDEAPVSAPA